ncbi:MAG: sigma-54 dependent transcriptional regulator [Thermodesulfovibrionia bacterium]|nr:sigma-54 dependent transcriptional regulator [Thermodesulfovibrionia bacterium]
MPRLDARCKVDLPVNIIYGNGGTNKEEKKARFLEVSLSGAYIDYKYPDPDKKIIGLRYELPKYGEFEILGKVIRGEKAGMATQFYNINRDAKLKLWDYIKENIVEGTICPYCGKDNGRKVKKCVVCGWNLDFNSPGYLVEHEKESFINRLTTRCKTFSLEDIFKVLNFVDVEILGIGKCWDINEEFVGSSRPMLEIFSMIRRVAPTELPVLITGESGTGKELTAMAIHERSLRKEGPFIPINCAAIPENLLETELFGYEKGAFTGASNNKMGKFEYAEGGTIFLDEIGELPIGLQSKILRFFEDKIVERIGSKGGKKLDVRIIAATSVDLKSAIVKGVFRKDLFYRLDAFRINLPALRERGDDKVILARYFLNKFCREMNVSKTFAKEAIDAIKNYDWPGNVREMINKIRSAIVMCSDTTITPSDLDLRIPTIDNAAAVSSLRDVRNTLEKQKLIEALNICSNNISKTAKVLGISRPSVYSLKKKYNI